MSLNNIQCTTGYNLLLISILNYDILIIKLLNVIYKTLSHLLSLQNIFFLFFQIFDKLRNEQPSCFKKLIPIAGNTSEKQLGMSQIDIEMLIEEVTIVVHAAADVKFNNTLQHAIFANTRSVREICILAQGMKKLIVSKNTTYYLSWHTY